MRGLLGTLRDARSGETVRARRPRTPEPGVADLPALVAERTAAGLVTAYDVVESSPVPAQRLPATVGLSLYRIAQEALANSTSHSTRPFGARRAACARTAPPPYAEVEVLDDGRPRGHLRQSGLGQLGIRERAATHAGRGRDRAPRRPAATACGCACRSEADA